MFGVELWREGLKMVGDLFPSSKLLDFAPCNLFCMLALALICYSRSVYERG